MCVGVEGGEVECVVGPEEVGAFVGYEAADAEEGEGGVGFVCGVAMEG